MNLLLKIINNPEVSNYVESYQFSKTGGTIGSDVNSTWVLPDVNKAVSDTHLEVSYHDKRYFIFDMSSEGTYYKHNHQALSKQEMIVLNKGEVLIVGSYEIEVDFVDSLREEDDILEIINKREIDVNMEDNGTLKKHYDSAVNVILKEKATDKDILSYLDIIPDEEDPFAENREYQREDTLCEHIPLPSFEEEESDDELKLQREVTQTPSDSKDMDGFLLAILSQKLGIDIDKLDRADQIKIVSELGDILMVAIDGVDTLSLNAEKIMEELGVKDKRKKEAKKPSLKKRLMKIKDGEKLSKRVSLSFQNILNHHTSLYSAIERVDRELSREFSPKNLSIELTPANSKRSFFGSNNDELTWREFSKKYAYLDEKKDELSLTKKSLIKEYKKSLSTLELVKGEV